MALRPLRTIPLRFRLRARRFQNKVQKRFQQRYWARASARGVPSTSARRPGDILTVELHPYALLGHQASGWMSGYLWARDLDLDYVGSPLPEDTNGVFVLTPDSGSVEARKRAIVRLPATEDERDGTSLAILRSHVDRARRNRPATAVEFRLPLDHPRFDHTPASDVLRSAVLAGSLGNELKRLEAGEDYVAVHVRRPARENEIGPNTHPDRWLTSEWYAELIGRIRAVGELNRLPIRVYSLGDPKSFAPLSELDGVHLHLNGERDRDFVELSAARLLVAAPSSFSFSAALVSRGAVIARAPWWHHIPDEGRWTHVDGSGLFSEPSLKRALAESAALRPRNVGEN